MSKRETDILLIRKYLNGELDARAMYQLERRAQDDPFLMDALEGYEKAGNDQEAQLNDINSRLQQRMAKKERRIIPWRTLSIAASVLIIFTVGGLLLYNNNQKEVVRPVAQLVQPVARPKAVEPVEQVPEQNKEVLTAATIPHQEYQKKLRRPNADAVAKVTIIPPVVAEKPASAEVITKDKAIKDTTPLNEMVVMGYATQKKKNVTQSVAQIQPQRLEERLESKVSGVQAKSADTFSSGYLISSGLLQGRVVDKIDGSPLPGATIKFAGTNKATVTDAKGFFKLPVDSNKTNLSLVVGYIGYETLNINTSKRDSLKTIALAPNHGSLNEVVVTGLGIKKEDNYAVIISAHPQQGWSSFKEYIKENAVSPDDKTGVVKLSFIVDHNGMISEIKIIKGLSSLADHKAISLINDGPDWTGSTTGQPELVKVKIKFAKK